MPQAEPPLTLVRAVDQLDELLRHVSTDRLDDPSPCSEWTVADLVDHVVSSPAQFATMMRGERPDWSAQPVHVAEGWATAFRSAADDLLQLWLRDGATEGSDPAWQTAEFAVHSWDLAHALGRSTAALDPEVAEQGLAFMRANLTAEMRGAVFGPEQPVGSEADAYDAIAAFAGRTVAT